MRKISPQCLQILKLLLKKNLINEDIFEGTKRKHEEQGTNIDEILLGIGKLDEKTYLSAIAAHFGTKFVTFEKLRKAQFDESLLTKIPAETARKLKVFPIAFNGETSTLTIITPHVNNISVISDLERICGVRRVIAYAALNLSVILCIRRWYEKDYNAFRTADEDSIQTYDKMLEVYEEKVIEADRDSLPDVDWKGKMFEEKDLERTSEDTSVAPKEDEISITHKTDFPHSIQFEDYLKTIQIFMGFLEKERGDLKGHSIQVSRYIQQIGERLRLPRKEVILLATGGLLHDIGKGGMFHLTTLNVSLYEGHRESAISRYNIPAKVFEEIQLPPEVKSTTESMYEKYDGTGFPQGLSGREIPIGARILAVADTFSDLTSHQRNPLRKKLNSEEAMNVLHQHQETIFDPIVVNALKLIVATDKLRTSILAGENSVLIIDEDIEQATILDIGLANRGYRVEICTNSKVAIEKLKTENHGLVLTEVALEPFDGFELIRKIKRNKKTKDIPVVFYTSRSATKDVSKGFELGAVDYIIKPASVELILAKIQKIISESASKRVASKEGVSGSLREMDLPDLIQVLSQGHKTGKLKISTDRGDGEIHFMNGQIVNAIFGGKEGEEAFYKTLHVKDGYFTIDPRFTPAKVLIKVGTEALLLEGMRLLDESQR